MYVVELNHSETLKPSGSQWEMLKQNKISRTRVEILAHNSIYEIIDRLLRPSKYSLQSPHKAFLFLIKIQIYLPCSTRIQITRHWSVYRTYQLYNCNAYLYVYIINIKRNIILIYSKQKKNIYGAHNLAWNNFIRNRRDIATKQFLSKFVFASICQIKYIAAIFSFFLYKIMPRVTKCANLLFTPCKWESKRESWILIDDIYLLIQK